MCFAPTFSATVSSALHIFFSDSLRSQGPITVLPFSPVLRLFSSSSSVLMWPPARTFQGARAIPVKNGAAQEASVTKNYITIIPKEICELTFMFAHGKNLALDVSLHNGVCCLINDERCLPVPFSVLVCLRDEPGWSIRDPLKLATRCSI